MKKLLVILSLFISSLCTAQTKDLFDKVPNFLVNASSHELAKVFKAPAFFRFSTTFPDGVIVAYENTSKTKMGSLDEILNQISKVKSKLGSAKNEKPEVEYFEWANFTERIETYPCGLVAVFRNNELGEVWVDIK